MTISRCSSIGILSFLVTIVLTSCSDKNDKTEVEELRKEVSDLRARLDEREGEAVDDIVSKSWDVDPAVDELPKVDVKPALSKPYSADNLTDRLERDQTKREIDNLKRKVDLDRMNRDIERQDDERKAKRKELEHSLGLDHPQ
jgi:hypothetical protein